MTPYDVIMASTLVAAGIFIIGFALNVWSLNRKKKVSTLRKYVQENPYDTKN